MAGNGSRCKATLATSSLTPNFTQPAHFPFPFVALGIETRGFLRIMVGMDKGEMHGRNRHPR